LSLALAVAVLSGCGKSENKNTPPESGSKSDAPQPEATVELSPSQLSAIKIEPVGTYRFPVEKEAVGSVSFDEDPAMVQAESTLLGAATTFELTRKELARVTALGETNGIAQKELEQATADHQTADAALKAARDAVRALGKTDAEIDEMVAAGKIESAPATTRWVLVNVLESDGPLFRVGQPVQVKVMAYPDRGFEGKVSRIYATVDPNTHRMAIRCEVEDSKDELRPGMLANIRVHVQDPVEATAIPANGVVRESDGTMTAWVTTDRHRFTQKVVQTGLRRDGQVQILEGLQRGELAVTEGAVFLSNMLNAPPSD
jgi:cobalt-zinc-cadmium efflux system membrane fusion protein